MLLTKLLRTSVAALGTLAVASVTQADAADIYSGGGYKDVPMAPPCCSFSGFYIGGNMGIAWSNLKLDGGNFYDGSNGYAAGNNWFGGKSIDSTNGFGGGQFGYNWQNQCCYLFGIEVDLGALALNNNNHRYWTDPNASSAVYGVSWDNSKNNDAFFAGDVTGRIVFTFGNSLLYVKGGFAFVDANNTGLLETIYWKPGMQPLGMSGLGYDTFGNSSGDNWLTGWTIGAGYEWKPCCQSNWSIKVEYLYYDFGNNNNNNCCNDYYASSGYNNWRNKNDLTVNTVKIGFNYFLNPVQAAPLK